MRFSVSGEIKIPADVNIAKNTEMKLIESGKYSYMVGKLDKSVYERKALSEIRNSTFRSVNIFT